MYRGTPVARYPGIATSLECEPFCCWQSELSRPIPLLAMGSNLTATRASAGPRALR